MSGSLNVCPPSRLAHETKDPKAHKVLERKYSEMRSTERQMTRRQYLTLMAGTAAAALAPNYLSGETGRTVMRLAVSSETLAGAQSRDCGRDG